ncbi:MAG: cytochrome c [Gammaproteobacteria bacterium]
MRYLKIILLVATQLLPVISQAESEGEQLYKAYCVQCHGINGDGKGLNAAFMSVMPRDHRDKSEMSARTDEELSKVIKSGGASINKSILMPAWGGNLSDEQIEELVAYLRVVCCDE